MNEDLGVWTNEDSALVLIDYQPDQFESIRSETPADLIELNTRWLTRAAKAFDVPIVLSTIGVDAGTNGPTLPAITDELEGIEPIDRARLSRTWPGWAGSKLKVTSSPAEPSDSGLVSGSGPVRRMHVGQVPLGASEGSR